jgi:hypothetical protein
MKEALVPLFAIVNANLASAGSAERLPELPANPPERR